LSQEKVKCRQTALGKQRRKEGRRRKSRVRSAMGIEDRILHLAEEKEPVEDNVEELSPFRGRPCKRGRILFSEGQKGLKSSDELSKGKREGVKRTIKKKKKEEARVYDKRFPL